jgi:hypothetical protein
MSGYPAGSAICQRGSRQPKTGLTQRSSWEPSPSTRSWTAFWPSPHRPCPGLAVSADRKLPPGPAVCCRRGRPEPDVMWPALVRHNTSRSRCGQPRPPSIILSPSVDSVRATGLGRSARPTRVRDGPAQQRWSVTWPHCPGMWLPPEVAGRASRYSLIDTAIIQPSGIQMAACCTSPLTVGCRNSFMQLVGGTRGAGRQGGRGGVHGLDPRSGGWTGWCIGRFQPECAVGTVDVVVLDVDPKHLLQVPAPNDQQPVQALGPHRPDPALGVGVSIGRLHRRD